MPESHVPDETTLSLRGQVISGRGKMKVFVSSNRESVETALGTPLVDGSLNLLLDVPVTLEPVGARRLEGGRLFWPAAIDGVDVWVFRWPGAPEHVIEVLSTTHLRSTLGLRDGDVVNVEINRRHVGEMPLRRTLIWSLAWLGRKAWYYRSDLYLVRVRGVEKALRSIRTRQFKELGRQVERAVRRPGKIMRERVSRRRTR